MGNLAVTTVGHQFDVLASHRREIAQALPRPASIRLSVHTRGLGETRLKGNKALSFGVLVLEEPSFTYGVISDQGDLQPDAVPLATAVVTRWVQTSSGMWVGAEMAFSVFLPLMDIESQQKLKNFGLKFSLIFEGTALRSTAATQGGSAQTAATAGS